MVEFAIFLIIASAFLIANLPRNEK